MICVFTTRGLLFTVETELTALLEQMAVVEELGDPLLNMVTNRQTAKTEPMGVMVKVVAVVVAVVVGQITATVMALPAVAAVQVAVVEPVEQVELAAAALLDFGFTSAVA